MNERVQQAPRVDLARLRFDVTRDANWVAIVRDELAALLAVLDAAREATSREGLHGKYGDVSSLVVALEPFTPRYDETSTLPRVPADRAWEETVAKAHARDRAWEEVDRWNAEQADRAWLEYVRTGVLAEEAVARAEEANPRDRARDQLADAGVVVQRQFRSDQERIAELEREVREAVLEGERRIDALTSVVGAAREHVRCRTVVSWDALTREVHRLDASESRWVGAKP